MTKTQRLAIELEKAIAKRDLWEKRVQKLKEQHTDAQNTEILGLVHKAQLTPEQLAQVIVNARLGVMGVIPDDTDEQGPFDEMEEAANGEEDRQDED